MIPLRVFNPDGVTAFGKALDAIRAGHPVDLVALRDDPNLTETISGVPVVPLDPSFPDRFTAAKHLFDMLEPYSAELGDIERNAGLWAWLALTWLDLLAPPEAGGARKLGAQPRYVAFVDDYKTYYRHLLAGPYRIYRAHQADPLIAMAVLATPVHAPGEVVEQFASRQEFIVNRNLLGAITRLYYDPPTKKIKKGAGGKGAGSARRLVDVLNQFDLTWDVQGTPSDDMVDLLPDEFATFAA